jgi:prevent-host-death family protein
MKTTTVRELRHHFGDVLRLVENGEPVAVTRRGKTVAELRPPTPAKPRKLQWPDFEARMKDIFGDKVLPDIIAAERESYDR